MWNNDYLMNRSRPVILYSNMLTFRGSKESFILVGDFLKSMTNYNFNFTHSHPQDQKLCYEFGEEMKIDIKQIGWISNGDKTLKKLIKSAAIMASGISTKCLPENPDKLCDRLKLILLEKQAGNISNPINEKNVAIVDKLLKYKCISTKQFKILQVNCSNWRKKLKLIEAF